MQKYAYTSTFKYDIRMRIHICIYITDNTFNFKGKTYTCLFLRVTRSIPPWLIKDVVVQVVS